MELWIRSQNKKELIPDPKLGIDQCENRYYIVDRYNFENAFILGEYKSKERALEVLDEIQEFIEDKSQKIILIFICFNVGTHSIRRFPDFICKLLLIHKGVLRSIFVEVLFSTAAYHCCASFAFFIYV